MLFSVLDCTVCTGCTLSTIQFIWEKTLIKYYLLPIIVLFTPYLSYIFWKNLYTSLTSFVDLSRSIVSGVVFLPCFTIVDVRLFSEHADSVGISYSQHIERKN